ncbi:hypothetical protein Kisp02_37340 [Kineosporia sp. NBRC 101731]|nr:hypothetical protein Kisp02_37340 [Kineosporia sp. NBRC 101731]
MGPMSRYRRRDQRELPHGVPKGIAGANQWWTHARAGGWASTMGVGAKSQNPLITEKGVGG